MLTSTTPALLRRSEAAQLLGVSLYRLDTWLRRPEIFEPGSWYRSPTGHVLIQRYAVERIGNAPFRTPLAQRDPATREQIKKETEAFWKLVGR